MDEARLQELEIEVRDQYALLGRLQHAVRQQEERLAALRAELEALRQLLAEESQEADARGQSEMPF
jgi:uncharacterized coiled-coil protein SlyX